ncbi:MAG: OmpA family protein [Pseudomonadota bacterium]|nr:OmpA family protein [Pseudomonadota bacterium]
MNLKTPWRLAALTTLTALLAACAAPPPSASVEPLPLDQAITSATDALALQTRSLPAFIAKLDKRSLVIDPMIDSGSGQQTALTRQIEEGVSARLASEHTQLPVLPFQLANLNRSQYVLSGTTTRLQNLRNGNRAPFQIDLALTELKSGVVVAQASARARDDGQDTTPTPYYRDSPVLVKDKVVDGYIRTCQTPPGQPAAKDYFERLATATTINEATVAYNNEKYQESLALYKTALASPSGEQLRTLNGIYLASWKLGHTQEAEQAFGKVVALGIANSSLGVKLLFNPGTTDFWSDPKVSGPYPIWLRQIVKQTAQAKVCMNIVGHTSRTGGEAYNDRLSAARSASIRQKLGAEPGAADLLARTKTSGVGSRENIIGTGTDDAGDSLDRRVEFKIVAC